MAKYKLNPVKEGYHVEKLKKARVYLGFQLFPRDHMQVYVERCDNVPPTNLTGTGSDPYVEFRILMANPDLEPTWNDMNQLTMVS